MFRGNWVHSSRFPFSKSNVTVCPTANSEEHIIKNNQTERLIARDLIENITFTKKYKKTILCESLLLGALV
jgi:hypothetical protein